MNYLEYDIGALYRGVFRRMLIAYKFHHNIEYVEAKRFISSKFYIRGEDRVIESLLVDWKNYRGNKI